MDPLQPLRVHIRFDNIHVTAYYNAGAVPTVPPTYLWTVFFKIDGDTAFLDELYTLQGTATVVGTPGNHGDLGDTEKLGDISVPGTLGEFRTVLRPIPLKKPLPGMSNVAGAIGCVAIFMGQDGTPDDATAAGHDALNKAIQNELNNLIPTLGINKQEPTKDDITGIQQRVGDTVQSTIKNDVSVLQILESGGNEDWQIGSVVFRPSVTDLLNSDPTGFPQQNTFSYGEVYGEAGWWRDNWQLTGIIFANPFDFSLRRFMASQRLNPANGIRASMGAFASVRNWIVNLS